MSRITVSKQPCGCEIHYEPISRSLHIRERWGKLCAAHDAEFNERHQRAQREHEEARRLKALEEEFT